MPITDEEIGRLVREMPDEFVEQLAELAHHIWARWTEYMIVHLTVGNLRRWRTQCNTAYKDLSDTEKKSDRDIATEWLLKIHELAEPQEDHDDTNI